jgi:predicted transcriptional regulator
MPTRVMVTLHDEVYRRVEHLAALTHREVADLLADTITLALQPLAVSTESVPVITSLADEEVLGLTELQMAPEQDRRLSALLQTQQERALSAAEQGELVTLMQVYQEGLLRKAQALHEAVRRGLRTPLEP